MGDMMEFPESIEKFLDDYSFKDAEQVYTNGAELIQVYRVKQAFEHYDVVHAIQALDKIREFIGTYKISCPECLGNLDAVDTLAKIHAINLVRYGVDVTTSLETATQQSYAMNQAYMKGYESGIRKAMLHNRDKHVPEEEHNDGWILCSEHMPEEHESMFARFKGTDKWDDAMHCSISDDVNVTCVYEDGSRKTLTLHTVDGEWDKSSRFSNFEVIAWRPLPEPLDHDNIR